MQWRIVYDFGGQKETCKYLMLADQLSGNTCYIIILITMKLKYGNELTWHYPFQLSFNLWDFSWLLIDYFSYSVCYFWLYSFQSLLLKTATN